MMPASTISRLAELLELQSKALLQDGLVDEASAALARARHLKMVAEFAGA